MMKRTVTGLLPCRVGPVLFLALWLSGCQGDPAHHSIEQPNIVLILADDLGYDDLGIHGNPIVETPHLDRLASQSVQFNQFYVTPVCATTRASLLTGRHFLRTGVSHVHGGKDFLHRDEHTLAEVLKEAGYVTGMWGKWHSGKTPGYFPWDRGFDEAYMATLYQHTDNAGRFNGLAIQTEGWTTEVLTDMAIRFMENRRNQPFFAYLPYLTCHAPLKCPDTYRQKYRDQGVSENLATLYGMVEQLDDQVGRLVSALEDLGITEHTLVLFMSDNGPAILNNLFTDEDRAVRYVNGMRGHKGNIWENGIRSPLWIRWEGTLEPRTLEQLADVTDLFPTLATLAGVSPDQMGWPLDGVNLLPLLIGGSSGDISREIYLYANRGWPPSDLPWTPEGVKDEYRPWKYDDGDNLFYRNQVLGIRTKEYKLLMNPGTTDGAIEPDPSGYVLVNMRMDPLEKNNLADKHPDLLDHLQQKLSHWYDSLLREPHAFEMPVFSIGTDTSEKYSILAYAPHSTSKGLKNASNYIYHFREAGDSACYQLEAEQEGIYGVDLSYKLDGNLPRSLVLRTEGFEGTFKFSPESTMTGAKRIPLKKGPATLTLLNVEKQASGTLRLHELIFRYMHETDKDIDEI